MNVLEIVEAHLKAHGLDGLYNSDLECACELADLAPCAEIQDECTVGFRGPCDCGEHDYHIVRKKPGAS